MNKSIKRMILVIEDNEINRMLLCSILEEDYNILEAENGQEGLDLLKENYRDISAILLDLQMPVMNGYQFLDIVQKDDILKSIPVIVITANDTLEEEEYCLGIGASDFIIKPYNQSIVKHRINNVINLRESASTISAIEYDITTGLYTRPAFIHHAEELRKANPDINFTLLMIKLEKVEDTLVGYGGSDMRTMTKPAADKIRELLVRDNYVVGRYSTTRFVIFGPDVEGFKPEKVILKSDKGFTCRFIYGMVKNVHHDLDMSQIFNQALAALQGIQHQYGHYYAIYDEKMMQKEIFRQAIENRMSAAVRENQFKVYYQPKHDIKTGRLAGAEALIRWINPELGFISPGEFIPVFEETGFVIESDFYVWERTCQNVRRWKDAGLNLIPISVNCSQKGFADETMTERWIQAKNKANTPNGYLHIEITESSLVGVVKEMVERLKQLRDNDVEVELDDFGSGYSSLNMLGALPLDYVKLDMGFVDNIDNPRKLHVMTACVNLIHELGYKIVVEGVETEHHLDVARSLGIDMAQGYYFSKPLPEDEFEAYIMQHN